MQPLQLFFDFPHFYIPVDLIFPESVFYREVSYVCLIVTLSSSVNSLLLA